MRKPKTFKTFQEYKDFYAIKEKPKGSKYYRIGVEIARKACEKAKEV